MYFEEHLSDMNINQRQMNMDYSVCQALAYRAKGLKSALVIYDVACEWVIHFLERVAQNPHLSLEEWDEFIAAVGDFHLGAHVRECFAPFSLNFVHGAGDIEGEILEPSWSDFNKVSANARSMSNAHRREVYDDHMRNWNWMKIVGMSKSFWGFLYILIFYLFD